MKRHLSAMFIALGLSVAPANGGDFWQTKDFLSWSEKEVRKMLKDSPWARSCQIRAGSVEELVMNRRPQSSAPCCTEGGTDSSQAPELGMEALRGSSTVTAVVRWQSALPVRQALARQRFGDEASTSPEAAKMLAPVEQFYVLAVVGLPPQLVQGTVEELKSNAVLKIKNKPPIQAADIRGSREEDGINLYFFFPRDQSITLADREVELAFRLSSAAVSRKFRLKQMVYEGKLEM